MKNAVFWDMMTPRSSRKNRRFGGRYRLEMEAICFSETPALTRTKRHRHIPEDGILQKNNLHFCSCNGLAV
jgi:hypothetical protein